MTWTILLSKLRISSILVSSRWICNIQNSFPLPKRYLMRTCSTYSSITQNFLQHIVQQCIYFPPFTKQIGQGVLHNETCCRVGQDRSVLVRSPLAIPIWYNPLYKFYSWDTAPVVLNCNQRPTSKVEARQDVVIRFDSCLILAGAS